MTNIRDIDELISENSGIGIYRQADGTFKVRSYDPYVLERYPMLERTGFPLGHRGFRRIEDAEEVVNRLVQFLDE